MNLEEKNKKVDKAWTQLYDRIEKDGLLDEKKKFRTPALRWSAYIAAACICGILAFTIYNYTSNRTEMIVVYNDSENSSLVTTLEDGSIVYLSGKATLSYSKHFEKDKRQVILRGEAFFDISKDQERPFFIETESADIEVLGTSFNVKSEGKDLFSLSVSTGEVRVTSKKTEESSKIKPGQTVSLNSGTMQIISNQNKSLKDYFNYIQFKDERLADIIKVINLNSDNIRIELAKGLENRLLTVTFLKETPDNMAQLICLALNLQYEKDQNVIRIYNSN